MKRATHIYYDKEGDFLEISLGKPTKCYADEVEPGIFVRKDEQTHEVKSIGILGFRKRTKNFKANDISLPVNVALTSK